MKVVIGLDLSVNSTGITVFKGDERIYYLIVSKMTKQMKECKEVSIIEYEKKDNINENLKQIGDIVESIIDKYDVDVVIIEDVAMGAMRSRSIIDLTGLNYWIRCLLMKRNIKYITIPPTQWKKDLIGNGQATKDLIVDNWKRLTRNDFHLKKVDDIADSYFLGLYGLENYKNEKNDNIIYI